MRSFRTFVEDDRPRPGSPNPVKPGPTPIYRSAAYNAGVTQGKAVERQILRSLETSCGWRLEVPEDWRVDAFDAVDTYLITADGKRIPVQIKARKQGVGDDIGYEVAKDYGANDEQSPPPPGELLRSLNGRDMRGSAKLTAVLSQAGDRITVIDTNEGHALITTAVAYWLEALKRFAQWPAVAAKYLQGFSASGVELVYKFDRRDRYWKVIAYIKPEAFGTTQVCALDARIGTQFT